MLHVTNYRNNANFYLKAPWKFENNTYRSIVFSCQFLIKLSTVKRQLEHILIHFPREFKNWCLLAFVEY